MKSVLEYKDEKYVFTYECEECGREVENKDFCEYCDCKVRSYARLNIEKKR